MTIKSVGTNGKTHWMEIRRAGSKKTERIIIKREDYFKALISDDTADYLRSTYSGILAS